MTSQKHSYADSEQEQSRRLGSHERVGCMTTTATWRWVDDDRALPNEIEAAAQVDEAGHRERRHERIDEQQGRLFSKGHRENADYVKAQRRTQVDAVNDEGRIEHKSAGEGDVTERRRAGERPIVAADIDHGILCEGEDRSTRGLEGDGVRRAAKHRDNGQSSQKNRFHMTLLNVPVPVLYRSNPASDTWPPEVEGQ